MVCRKVSTIDLLELAFDGFVVVCFWLYAVVIKFGISGLYELLCREIYASDKRLRLKRQDHKSGQ